MAKQEKKDDSTLFNIDIDIDFDLSDFDLIDRMTENLGETPQPQGRILKPRVEKDEILKKVMFENAEAFADQISLDPNTRTFAWVSGSFIFGDILEALVYRRGVVPRRLYICTLSLSQENIDSLKNVMLACPELERLVLVVSGYFYSHEKFSLVPYMYDELDDGTDRVQIAFGGYHCKIMAMETAFGHTLTIHGSANLRSSNSVEQIMIEQGRDLYEMNRDIMENIAQRFGTINHKAPKHKLHRIEGKEAWEVSKQWQAEA